MSYNWKLRVTLLMPVWLLFYISWSHLQNQERITKADVIVKTGTIESARCVYNRSADVLKLDVLFNDETSLSKISRQLTTSSCSQELVDNIIHKVLKVGFYKNRNIGFYLGKQEIESIDDGIKRANDKNSSILLLSLIAIGLSFMILVAYSREVQN